MVLLPWPCLGISFISCWRLEPDTVLLFLSMNIYMQSACTTSSSSSPKIDREIHACLPACLPLLVWLIACWYCRCWVLNHLAHTFCSGFYRALWTVFCGQNALQSFSDSDFGVSLISPSVHHLEREAKSCEFTIYIQTIHLQPCWSEEEWQMSAEMN